MTISKTISPARTPHAPWKQVWIVVRFIVFGVGGFWLLMFCWLALVEALTPHGEHLMNPFLALTLALIGALMMLFGGGAWGRWAYLWVFLSTPIAVSFLLLLSPFFPDLPQTWEILDPKLLGILAFASPMIFSFALVRRYYRHRETSKTSLTNDSAKSKPENLEAK